MTTRTSRAAACAVGLAAVVCARGVQADELPQIDGTQPMKCLHDGDGRLWRVQCSAPDDKERICLYAPNSELSDDGEWTRKLERARSCYDEGAFDQEALQRDGYRLVLARADAPYGWARDERGRVYQVIFDLHRRIYVGAAWVLRGGDAAEGRALTHAVVDFGLLEFELPVPKGRRGEGTRHRVALVRGQVGLAPFTADAVLLHWDMSRRFFNPLLRITTFWPKPRRHDLIVHLGAWVEAGGIEVHDTPASGDESLWRFATAHLTYDVWQSRDLYSFVRMRGGVGLERTYTDAANADRSALTPAVAIDGNVTLDARGFHHVVVGATYERPAYYEAPETAGDHAQRVKAELGYEMIFLAVNDQPLTLRVASGTSWRDDIPGIDPQWAFTATAGLRLSLWAPARQRY